MTFPEFLRAQVDRIAPGQKRIGELRVAIALGVSDRTIRMWANEEGKPPAAGMIAGAQVLLPQIPPVPQKAIDYLTAPEKRKPRKTRHDRTTA